VCQPNSLVLILRLFSLVEIEVYSFFSFDYD